MYSTTKEHDKALRRHQYLPLVKSAIIHIMKELDGMALEYELAQRINPSWYWLVPDAIDELIKDRWIYIVRKRK